MFPNCDIELCFNSPYLFPKEILRYDAAMLTEILSYTLSPAIQWDINVSHADFALWYSHWR